MDERPAVSVEVISDDETGELTEHPCAFVTTRQSGEGHLFSYMERDALADGGYLRTINASAIDLCLEGLLGRLSGSRVDMFFVTASAYRLLDPHLRSIGRDVRVVKAACRIQAP